MLQAHSFLWHYLWIAPNLLLLLLGFLIWRRKLHRQYPAFLIFAVVIAIEQLAVYVADILPSISPTTWWYVFWASLLVEALIKFALIGEIFGRTFGLFPSVAKLGRWLISAVGVLLVLVATVAAAYTSKDNIYWIRRTRSGTDDIPDRMWADFVPFPVCRLLQADLEPFSLRYHAGVGHLGLCTSCDLGAHGERGPFCLLS
jgi:hypothetical protein